MQSIALDPPPKRVNVVTLGCSKNVVDSEVLVGLLKRNNLHMVDEADGADAVVINTCGFIDLAKEESVNTILAAAALRSEGKIGSLYVAGCLSERYAEDLRREIPEVDGWFGVTDFARILKTLNPNPRLDLLGERYLPQGSPSAYVKISEGCDNPCSFCAIPLMRGGHRSRPIDEIVIEAHSLARRGVREIVVVAQDTTCYGLDIYGRRALAELLERLAAVRGIEWVRLMYAYPARFPVDILEVIAREPTICSYMDMPIQHVADPVLRSMRRGHSQRRLRELIGEIRATVPGIALRTTLIVGYPNEGAEEFEELCRFVSDMRFDRLGVFAYSQEEQTVAFDLGDPIPTELKQERIERVMEIQRAISAETNAEMIGTRDVVMVERAIDGEYVCRSRRDAPEVDGEVYLRSDQPLTPGDFVEVEITDAIDYDLFADFIALRPPSDPRIANDLLPVVPQ